MYTLADLNMHYWSPCWTFNDPPAWHEHTHTRYWFMDWPFWYIPPPNIQMPVSSPIHFWKCLANSINPMFEYLVSTGEVHDPCQAIHLIWPMVMVILDIYNYYRYEIVHQFGWPHEYNIIVFNDPVDASAYGQHGWWWSSTESQSFFNTIFKATVTAMIT